MDLNLQTDNKLCVSYWNFPTFTNLLTIAISFQPYESLSMASSGSDWLEVPTIKEARNVVGQCQEYPSTSPPSIWPKIWYSPVAPYFRILKFPLKNSLPYNPIIPNHRGVWNSHWPSPIVSRWGRARSGALDAAPRLRQTLEQLAERHQKTLGQAQTPPFNETLVFCRDFPHNWDHLGFNNRGMGLVLDITKLFSQCLMRVDSSRWWWRIADGDEWPSWFDFRPNHKPQLLLWGFPSLPWLIIGGQFPLDIYR